MPLDAAILFAPVGDLVPTALAALEQGATLAVAGIHLTDIPRLDYQRHLFRERTLTSVTANTRADGEELLRLAARLGLRAAGHDLSLRRASTGRWTTSPAARSPVPPCSSDLLPIRVAACSECQVGVPGDARGWGPVRRSLPLRRVSPTVGPSVVPLTPAG